MYLGGCPGKGFRWSSPSTAFTWWHATFQALIGELALAWDTTFGATRERLVSGGD
jgi:hypothetical protein